MLNKCHLVLEEGRYAGMGSPCKTENLGMCLFEEGGPIWRPSNGCAIFPCEEVLQPLPGSSEGAEVACAHLVLTFHGCPCPHFTLLALVLQWCQIVSSGCTAGVCSLPASGRVDQKRWCGLRDDLLCLCWAVSFCCNFYAKRLLVCFVTSSL